MKSYTEKLWRPPAPRTFLRAMKFTVLLLVIAVLQVNATVSAQRLTLNLNRSPLSTLFKEIRKQTGYDFFYTDDLLQGHESVSIHVKDAPLKEVLEQSLNKQALAFSIENSIIVISSKLEVQKPVPTKTIIGKIVDEHERPLAGVTIKVKGSSRAVTASNDKGEFVIVVPDEQAILQVSYIGYTSVEVPVKSLKSPAMIALKAAVSDLNEIQITAYGTTTKRLNAGNITTITSAEIEKHPVQNVMEALQGNVPGLFIQQATGQPGGAFQMRMRGAANLNNAQNVKRRDQNPPQPLIIVDGVRYPAGNLQLSENFLYATEGYLQGGSGLNYINPNDIESINVLKDIDATAIYGSSGAYGVILITTKKAKSAQQRLSANVYTGISTLGKVPELLSTEQFLMLRREAFANDGKNPSNEDFDINGTWPEDRYTNWQKEFLGSAAATTNANVSYTGGSKNVSYLVNGSLRNVGNIQRHNGSNTDGSLRFGLNTSTDDEKFELNLSGSYLSSKNTMVPYDFSSNALLAPNAPPPFNVDGSINWDAIGTGTNSSGSAANSERVYKNVTNNLLANATLVYKPTNKITLRTIFGYNNLTGKENAEYPTTAFNPATKDAPARTVGIFHQFESRAITVSPYAEYRTTLGKKGNLSVKFGAEIDNTLTNSSDITGTGFASDALLGNPSAGSSVSTDYALKQTRAIGIYGIINYVLDEKYVLNINTRRDGSTRFGPGRRFGNFGSLAAAWIFSEEQFMKDNVPFISYGKLRASTGTVGGDAIVDFAYLSTYGTRPKSYDGKVGLAPNSLPNPLLSWERNRNSEMAIELGFFENRILADVSYYYNKASNQLISQPLSTVTGYNGYAINSDAEIRLNGYEINLNSTNIRIKNFSWNTRFNISLPKSKLLQLPSITDKESNYMEGYPVTGVKLYNYQGINPATGNYSFTNAKGETDDFMSLSGYPDKTAFIDLAPKFYGGFTNSFSYKRLTMDFTFNFTKRMAKNILGQSVFPLGVSLSNGSTEWLNRWQQPGDITDVPKLTNDFLSAFMRQSLFQTSTGAYSNATYARLQNVSIRYAFGAELLRKMGVKALSVYLQGQNLLTISNYGGLDPENLSIGVIPPLRVFTGGFNITL